MITGIARRNDAMGGECVSEAERGRGERVGGDVVEDKKVKSAPK